MQKKYNELPKLPESVKNLIIGGYYSLYTLIGDYHPYVLITNNTSAFYLSESGRVISTKVFPPIDKLNERVHFATNQKQESFFSGFFS